MLLSKPIATEFGIHDRLESSVSLKALFQLSINSGCGQPTFVQPFGQEQRSAASSSVVGAKISHSNRTVRREKRVWTWHPNSETIQSNAELPHTSAVELFKYFDWNSFSIFKNILASMFASCNSRDSECVNGDYGFIHLFLSNFSNIRKIGRSLFEFSKFSKSRLPISNFTCSVK